MTELPAGRWLAATASTSATSSTDRTRATLSGLESGQSQDAPLLPRGGNGGAGRPTLAMASAKEVDVPSGALVAAAADFFASVSRASPQRQPLQDAPAAANLEHNATDVSSTGGEADAGASGCFAAERQMRRPPPEVQSPNTLGRSSPPTLDAQPAFQPPLAFLQLAATSAAPALRLRRCVRCVLCVMQLLPRPPTAATWAQLRTLPGC
mmetsp:Transcript_52901/g.115769  ORF Transcript_52901/g.115769 Transcript_52901/m.115769 type:complete len:209 (-) Transcript_52901:253-879(-)